MIPCLNPATSGEGRTFRDFLAAAAQKAKSALDNVLAGL